MLAMNESMSSALRWRRAASDGRDSSVSTRSGMVSEVSEVWSGSWLCCICLASFIVPISRSMARSSASRLSRSAKGVGGVLTVDTAATGNILPGPS